MILPKFEEIIKSSKVSEYYHLLYQTKTTYLEQGSFPSTHDYFDCETVLECEHDGTKFLFLQADMDVVTDGTDPERAGLLSDYDEARVSNSFLPYTKHGWPNSASTPKNPFLDYYPDLLEELETLKNEISVKAKRDKGVVWRKLLVDIEKQIQYAKRKGPGTKPYDWIDDRRYPLATEDPFIVLPDGWFRKSSKWKPQPGNFAAAIHKGKIYPAILGDSGPEHKVGEASIKLAKMIHPDASGKKRAAEDLTVSYLVFPGTSSSPYPPSNDGGHLELWMEEVRKLLGKIGGISDPSVLHKW